MLGISWSHALIGLHVIVLLLIIDSYKQYEFTLVPLRTTIVVLFRSYSSSWLFHYNSIDYEQSNALSSTTTSCLHLGDQLDMRILLCLEVDGGTSV